MMALNWNMWIKNETAEEKVSWLFCFYQTSDLLEYNLSIDLQQLGAFLQ